MRGWVYSEPGGGGKTVGTGVGGGAEGVFGASIDAGGTGLGRKGAGWRRWGWRSRHGGAGGIAESVVWGARIGGLADGQAREVVVRDDGVMTSWTETWSTVPPETRVARPNVRERARAAAGLD